MSSLRSSLIAVFAASVLILGASACSGDDTGPASDNTTAVDDTGSTGNDTDADLEGGVEDESGDNRGADVLKLSTKADSVDFDGTKLELTFLEGSRDNPSSLGCIQGRFYAEPGDITLIYPDGTYTCSED